MSDILDLSQRRAVDVVLSRHTGILVIQGPAGSGKTTLVRALVRALSDQKSSNRLTLCSPTGKACARLSERAGTVAYTLHSLMMKPTFIEAKDRGIYDRIQGKNGKMHFASKGAHISPGQILVVDEASMLTREMCEELETFAQQGLLVLIGDGFQLPPVASGNFSVFDLGLETFTLSTVHRQQEGGAVISAANALIDTFRAGGQRPLEALGGLETVEQYSLLQKMDDNIRTHGHKGSTVITYKNSARDEITAAFRKHKGWASGTILEGEPVVITRNNREHDLYNGDICLFKSWVSARQEYVFNDAIHHVQQATLLNLRNNRLVNSALLLTASNLSTKDMKIIDRVNRERVVLVAEYGYVLTAHKAQGSEWDHVIVAYDDMWSNNAENKYRWAYTAITRAKRSCTVCELHRSSPLNFTRPTRPSPEKLAANPLLAKLYAELEMRDDRS